MIKDNNIFCHIEGCESNYKVNHPLPDGWVIVNIQRYREPFISAIICLDCASLFSVKDLLTGNLRQ